MSSNGSRPLRVLSCNIQAGSSTRAYREYITRSWSHVLPAGNKRGSLDAIAQAFHKVGLRGALCYETSDRNGPRQTQDAIRENVRFLERSRGDYLHQRGGTGYGVRLIVELATRLADA